MLDIKELAVVENTTRNMCYKHIYGNQFDPHIKILSLFYETHRFEETLWEGFI